MHNFNTVSFRGIYQVLNNETFCIVLMTSQVVLVQSLQPKGCVFESTYVLVFYFLCVCFFHFYLMNLSSFIIDIP